MKKKESTPAVETSQKSDIDIAITEVEDITAIPAEVNALIAEELSPAPAKVRKKTKASEREHYVNSKEFENHIRSFYASGVITDDLAESINKIANGLSFAPNFINYSYKGDMVGDAIVKMFSALQNKKFKVDSGFSPFSYFTTIAFHAFINRIKKEKRYHEAITKYREKVYTELMQTDEIPSGSIYLEPNHNEDDDLLDE